MSLPGYDAWISREPDEYTGPSTWEVEVLVVAQMQATADEADDKSERIVAQIREALKKAPIEGQITDVTFGNLEDMGPVE
jgi:hypothetical protein